GGLLVEQHDGETVAARLDRGRHAGGTRADDRDVAGGRERLRFAHHTTPVARAPCWRSTRMPSRTATMQACWFGRPSMTTRQSKHTPIMQYGPRGWLATAVVRQADMPAPSRAAATLSPARARYVRPSTCNATVSAAPAAGCDESG